MKNIKRVLLLDLFADRIVVESVGLGSLSAYLKQHGYETMLRAYPKDSVEYDQIMVFQPDIVGITVNFETIGFIGEVCDTIYRFIPDVIFFTGGYLASNNTEAVMTDIPIFEFAIRGEGELSLLAVLQAIANGRPYSDVEGISYRENGKLIHNIDRTLIQDLDILPFPDRSVMRQYAIPIAQIEGARGCPCRCTFCSYQAFWACNNKQEQGNWRAKSPSVIVDEIEQILREDGITRFRFLDSSFENPHLNSERMNQIADELIKRDLNITYFVNFRASVHRILDESLMHKLIQSGLISIFLGIESFDRNDLKIFNKSSTEDDTYRAIELLQSYPIYLNIGMINFHPYATTGSLRKNAEMLQKYGFSGRLLFLRELTIFDGTPICDQVRGDGLMQGKYHQVYNYKFNDLRVEFIYRYLQELHIRYPDLIKLETYATSYSHLLNHLKRYFTKAGDHNAVEHVGVFEQKLTDILTMLGDGFTRLALSLIDLSEKGWNNVDADRLFNNVFGTSVFADFARRLELSTLVLQKNLLRINPNYINHFVYRNE
jgi:radical SAM superfamily enzyme YgiQ (UPF0313 family)